MELELATNERAAVLVNEIGETEAEKIAPETQTEEHRIAAYALQKEERAAANALKKEERAAEKRGQNWQNTELIKRLRNDVRH